MYRSHLFELLETEEVKNNPNLYKELYTLWEKSSYSIDSYDLEDLSIGACEYLLNNNLSPCFILEAALRLEFGEVRNQLISRALSREIDWSGFGEYRLQYASISPEEVNKFLENGLGSNVILEMVALHENYKETRDQFIELALSKEVNWKAISYSNINQLNSIIGSKKLLDHGLDAVYLIKIALQLVDEEDAEKREQLIDLALRYKADCSSMNDTNIRSISVTEATKLLDCGLEANHIIKMVMNKDGFGIKEKNDQLLDLALTYKVDLNSISYFDINMFSYQRKYISVSNAKKLLDHGLDAIKIFKISLQYIGETHDELLDLALAYKIDLSSLHYYDIRNISIVSVKKLLDHGLDANEIVKFSLDLKIGEKHDQLLDLALTYKVDLNSIYYFDIRNISIESVKKLLDHGLDATKLIEVGNIFSDKDVYDQILDLALTYKINWSSLNVYAVNSFSISNTKKLLEHGLDATTIVRVALASEDKERHDQLLDLTLTYEVNLGYLDEYNMRSISIDDIEKLSKYGFNSETLFHRAKYGKEEEQYKLFKFSLENGLNPTKLLQEVLQLEVGEKREKLVELALTYKIELNYYNDYFYLKYMTVNEAKKFLDCGLTPENILDISLGMDLGERRKQVLEFALTVTQNIDEFLKKASYASITEWDSASEKHLPSLEKIKSQGEMIKLALDKGANINDSSLSINSDALFAHYDLLLNHPNNSISLSNFLEKALSASITEWDSASDQYLPNLEKVKLQAEMIKLALDKGANINDSSLSINSDALFTHYDLLLSHPTNPMSPSNFLGKVSSASINEWDSVLEKHLPSPEKIKLQGEMIKLALDKGAVVNDPTLYIYHQTLYNNHDLLLNHPSNPMSLEKFLEMALKSIFYISEDGKYILKDSDIKQKAELLEIAYQKHQNSLNLKELHSIEALVVKELSNRRVLDDQTMLKLALKAPGINYSENGQLYDLDEVGLQKDLIEGYLAKGSSIEELSFKELNIEYNHVSILKLLLSNGLDPRALLIHQPHNQDFPEVLNLALEHNVKPIGFNSMMLLFPGEINIEIAKLIIANLELSINDKLSPEKIINDFIAQGPKFKAYFEELSKDVDINQAIKPIFAEGGSILHMLVKSDKQEIIKFVLESYEYNINLLNDLGQSPLFFAKGPEIASALIEHGADLSIKDKNGNIWVSNPSLELIEYAVENDYLPKDYAEKVALSHFSKGNYEHAAKLYKIGFELKVDPVSEVVGAIMNGLKNSLEKNKYQAILNLINKAGIKVPGEFKHLLNSYDDEHDNQEFEFINGLLHKLAKHYINLSKASLEKALGKSAELDHAFESLNFEPIKSIHPNNIELAKITDSFSAYYQISGKALNILDNDFALESLTINGLRPTPLEKEVTVFRGMKVNLDEGDKDSYFKYGHRGFSTGEYQKTLGFYVDQPWNDLKGRWEYGGTYASVEAVWASHFADGITSFLEAESVLIEIKLPKIAPKICGSWKYEYELIPSNIDGQNIVAIYTLDIYSDKEGKHYQVNNVTKNPYIDAEIMPHFKSYDKIKSDPASIKTYDSLGCKELPTVSGINKSGLYKNYTDFMERYTQDAYLADQVKLAEDYFFGRENYVEEFSYGFFGECNVVIECCL